ncbi:MAG: hypothetical protein RLP44_20175 [Aggregatilineales bacterium]
MKTQPAHELILQAWWDEALIYSDHFFDTTANLNGNESNEKLSLFSELRNIRDSFENAEYPHLVGGARQYLLNSMSEVMLSFRAFFAGDAEAARIYMHAAQHELINLQLEMDRLGVGNRGGEPLLH